MAPGVLPPPVFSVVPPTATSSAAAVNLAHHGVSEPTAVIQRFSKAIDTLLPRAISNLTAPNTAAAEVTWATPFDMSDKPVLERIAVWVLFMAMFGALFGLMLADLFQKYQTGELQDSCIGAANMFRLLWNKICPCMRVRMLPTSEEKAEAAALATWVEAKANQKDKPVGSMPKLPPWDGELPSDSEEDSLPSSLGKRRKAPRVIVTGPETESRRTSGAGLAPPRNSYDGARSSSDSVRPVVFALSMPSRMADRLNKQV